jgi:hypothetical protein
VLIVLYRNILHDAGNVGRNPDFLGLHMGIVRRHHLTAGDVEVHADDQRERQ